MFLFVCILFVIICIGFCYMFLKVLEIEKDIETLYTNYADTLEKVLKNNLNRERGERHVRNVLDSFK